MDIRLGALKLYRQHLVAQYADRCAYWALKDISSDVMAQTITITTDGADQVPWFFFSVGKGGKQFKLQYVFFLKLPMSIMHEAKYQIPRDPDLRAAYRSSKFQRRSMLHGLSAMFFVWPFWKSALFTEAVW